MGSRAGDTEFDRFVAISEELKSEYLSDDRWVGSPFEWIKKRPSRQVGKVAEQLVDGWASAKGLDVEASPDSDADRLVEGTRVEIKSSTLWQGGFFKFQQIRDQNYAVLFCLGISPEEVFGWAFPKNLLMDYWRDGTIESQHGGASGTDTAWLQIRPKPVVEPHWVREWGGPLDEAYEKLVELV